MRNGSLSAHLLSPSMENISRMRQNLVVSASQARISKWQREKTIGCRSADAINFFISGSTLFVDDNASIKKIMVYGISDRTISDISELLAEMEAKYVSSDISKT